MADIPILSDIFGSKPQIADYTPIDLTEEQQKAISGNIENFPQFAELGNLYQKFMLDQYETAIPGFKEILQLGGQTTKTMLAQAQQMEEGKVPADVTAEVFRHAAFTSLGAGTLGGPMGVALAARDLGLTSLDLIGKGAALAGEAGNAAQRWASLAQAGGPAGMMITPAAMAELDMQQNLIKRNVQQQKYNVAAAPDPVAKGLSDIVETLTAAYLGGSTGGSIGAGNAQATSAAGQLSTGGGTYGGAGAGSSWGAQPAPTYGGGYGTTYNTTPYQSQIAPNPFNYGG